MMTLSSKGNMGAGQVWNQLCVGMCGLPHVPQLLYNACQRLTAKPQSQLCHDLGLLIALRPTLTTSNPTYVLGHVFEEMTVFFLT